MSTRLAAILALAVVAVSGCATSDSAAPAPTSSAAPGSPGVPGGNVIAPTMVDPTTATEVVVPKGSMVVLTVDSPAEWTATVEDPAIVTFQPGGSTSGYETNPGFVPGEWGSTKVTVTGPGAKSYTFTIIVKGSVTDIVSPPVPDMSPTAETTALAASLMGLTEKDAFAKVEATGRTIRLARRDKETFALTMDYRPDRINIEVDNGAVTEASIG